MQFPDKANHKKSYSQIALEAFLLIFTLFESITSNLTVFMVMGNVSKWNVCLLFECTNDISRYLSLISSKKTVEIFDGLQRVFSDGTRMCLCVCKIFSWKAVSIYI